jgi:hypothetical protein
MWWSVVDYVFGRFDCGVLIALQEIRAKREREDEYG